MAESSLAHKQLCPECGDIYDKGDIDHCPEDGAALAEFVVDDESDNDPLLGQILDERFAMQDVLGEGSMGRVYRATQVSVDRDVAVKTVQPGNATDEETVKRFHREAQAISDFSHPNIVKLVDFGQDLERGTLYLAMEYIEGYPIRKLTQRGRLEPALAVHLTIQLAGALAEVHSHGLVHRDLKPENLMVAPLADGRVEVKLLDFGIAHALRQSQNLTETGAVFGTPHFLSPEQAEAEEVGPYSDVYSLGAVLFAMLTGRNPVDAEDPMEVMVGHVQGEIPSIEELLGPGAISDHLNWLVGNMLSTRPEERPGDILRVRDVLKTIASLEEYETPEVDPDVSWETMFEPYLLPPADETWEPADGTVEVPGKRPLEETGEPAGGEPERSPPEAFDPPPQSPASPRSPNDSESSGTPADSGPPESASDESGETTEKSGEDRSEGRGFRAAPDEPTHIGANGTSAGFFAYAAGGVILLGVVFALYFAFGGGDSAEAERAPGETPGPSEAAPPGPDTRKAPRER